MAYSIRILRPARKSIDRLDYQRARQISAHINELKVDPYRPRPGMDIIKIEGDYTPPIYRLRIGRWRVEYAIVEEEKEIWIARVFPRRRDSDYK